MKLKRITYLVVASSGLVFLFGTDIAANEVNDNTAPLVESAKKSEIDIDLK
ncbi:hypothetical protein ACIJEB_002589 [Enterococcus faecium]|nr:hypothetical protein [Enterococcus faecium]